jgi:hypothetical protein
MTTGGHAAIAENGRACCGLADSSCTKMAVARTGSGGFLRVVNFAVAASVNSAHGKARPSMPPRRLLTATRTDDLEWSGSGAGEALARMQPGAVASAALGSEEVRNSGCAALSGCGSSSRSSMPLDLAAASAGQWVRSTCGRGGFCGLPVSAVGSLAWADGDNISAPKQLPSQPLSSCRALATYSEGQAAGANSWIDGDGSPARSINSRVTSSCRGCNGSRSSSLLTAQLRRPGSSTAWAQQ